MLPYTLEKEGSLDILMLDNNVTSFFPRAQSMEIALNSNDDEDDKGFRILL